MQVMRPAGAMGRRKRGGIGGIVAVGDGEDGGKGESFVRWKTNGWRARL